MNWLISSARSVVGKAVIVSSAPNLILAGLLAFHAISGRNAWIGLSVWIGSIAVLEFILRGEFTDERNRKADSAWRRRLPRYVEGDVQAGTLIGIVISAVLLLIVDWLS